MTYGSEDEGRRAPGQAAKELARLAAGARNPAERVWYLQWAQAFSQLAAFGAARRSPQEEPRDEYEQQG